MGLFNRLIAKVRGTSTASVVEWADIESELLASDLGPALVTSLIHEAKKLPGDDVENAMKEILRSKFSSKNRQLCAGDLTQIVLVVGVNGTGKTTSVAKLATLLHDENKSVLLGAADTFRAAAVEQLSTWADRIGVQTVSGKEGAEPAAVAFDSARRAVDEKVNYLIIDTAGRLHNKNDLMAELGKVKRVVEKVAPVSEVLLVIDATTGQNGMTQAQIFSEAVEVT
ncbi:MAG: AAA family ATPase, partial [Actinobacteria bacterium]|nr:AAA family ATPase [Actinomycetota bacterium]